MTIEPTTVAVIVKRCYIPSQRPPNAILNEKKTQISLSLVTEKAVLIHNVNIHSETIQEMNVDQ